MKAFCNNQRGISLIEAMVSMLLVVVMGLGLAYASSRALLVQRYTTTQNLAVIQMREVLQRPPIDSTVPLDLGGGSLTANYGSGTTQSITVSITPVNGLPISTTVESEAVGRYVKTDSDNWLGGTVEINTGTGQ
ncbi:type IV pilus modification PilV family protein [Stutzerimonas tarimensis]|uniref:Prepilin-type N-terminal cleavage/methylation domain-containing protein n=1 Tax=Stutzerimonas tarimensis TaxID=1507735 RepID=A0ABV7T2S7_9GAMM